MSQWNAEELAQVVARHEGQILADWLALLKGDGATAAGRIREDELAGQCRDLLGALRVALGAGDADPAGPGFGQVRALLGEISRGRALQGFSPSETAVFVLSLKQALFNAMREALQRERLAQGVWQATVLMDALALHTIEAFQRGRDEVISRQQREISELSTPVVKLWQGVLALPLIGTLDSERTQTVMENLLQSIVDSGAEIAIIDITGVPTVDTLVAQHLLKTIAAARLMGADCIVSGIRPQIAQTMVHLGVELNVVSKATLADALALALRRIGQKVVPLGPGPLRTGAAVDQD
jgi:rsbT co-antagonist protein RsbR